MIDKAKDHCTRLLLNGSCSKLPFHNIEHTKEVVDNARLISSYLGFTGDETEPILIAAWFHDTGLSKTYIGHEEVSKALASEFLKKMHYDPDRLETVLECIDATKMPQCPKNKYAEVLCDADLFHIGTPNFFFKKLLLRREWAVNGIMNVNEMEWHHINFKFLHENHFKTRYGKDILEKGKLVNEAKVKYILSIYN
ncbi:HD domain-containing protein [Allomuricauda sp. CP2A]|uniref:HD domain-containing protein n=1 Tax=Allomuricauda sp. CP2A TaxID=1848189 RepID=UPI0008370EDA|nr:HD domain-containing protein [Muricauda sp. CP2A]